MQAALWDTGGQICSQFISRRTFHQIRMIPPTKFHPCQSFSPNQDDSADQVSSLPELFSKPGCFRRPNFIPAGAFQQIRMIPPTKFHPCRSFLPNQDDSTDQISSLPELFTKSGWFRHHKMHPQPPKCILRRILPRIRTPQQRTHEKTFVFHASFFFWAMFFT